MVKNVFNTKHTSWDKAKEVVLLLGHYFFHIHIMIPDLPEHIIQNLKLFTGDIFLFLVTIPLIFLKLT